MADIGEAARRPVDDDDDDVTDLTGAAAEQGAKHRRGTAQALPVCGALWVCAAGPHLVVWNFLRACAWALGCTRGGSRGRVSAHRSGQSNSWLCWAQMLQRRMATSLVLAHGRKLTWTRG